MTKFKFFGLALLLSFSVANVNAAWDGMGMNGAKATDGTYFYIITVKFVDSDGPEVFKGSLTLFR